MNQNTDYQDEIGGLASEMLDRVTGEMKSYGSGEAQATVRLDKRLMANIDGAARFLKVSRSQFMARLIHDAFEDFDAKFRDQLRAADLREKAVEYVESVHGLGPEKGESE